MKCRDIVQKWYLKYRFDVDGNSPEEEKEVIVQLSQRDCRSLLMESKETLVIGFTILKVEGNRKYRLHQFSDDQIVAKSDYIKSKHIFLRTNLARNSRYVIVVTTFNPGESTDFLLRVFMENDADLTRLSKDVPTLKWYQFWKKVPLMVTRVQIFRASGLEKQDMFGKADPYAILTCEGQKVKTAVVKNSQEPVWNESFIFYRRLPRENPIKISLWNKNLTLDTFIGQVLVKTLEPFDELTLELKGRRGKKDESVPGQVVLMVENFTNLEDL